MYAEDELRIGCYPEQRGDHTHDRTVEPTPMDTSVRVLVPFDLPDADPTPPALIETLSVTEVVALGQFDIPEQTPSAVAREQFGDDARTELADIARTLEDAGISVETRLVFSSDREKAIDRVALEDDCDAILTPGEVDAIDRLFVALEGKPDVNRILSFVAELLAATEASVTLFHTDETTLVNATDRLVESGVEPGGIYQQLSESGDVRGDVLALEDECDLLVLGEAEPSLGEQVLGTVSARTTVDTHDPAFVVRSAG